MNNTNKELPNQKPASAKKRKKPRYWLMIPTLLLMFGVPFYWVWKSNFYDPDHQVPITCTVTNAEQYTSSGAGKSYSSSKDYIAFDTQECRTLLLPISTDDDYQSMINEIQKGKKYEFMMGESQIDVKSGAREVFSYSGPTE